MKLLKKIIMFIVITILVTETLIGAVPNNISSSSSLNPNKNGNPLKVGVVFYRFDDPFVALLKQSLENIEKKNEGKVKFYFYDSKNDQAIQNQTIDTLLESGNFDLILLSLVDLKTDPKEIINKVKEKNIPVIFFNRRPIKIDANIIESYDKAYYIVPDSEQSGILQGKILVDLWNKNKNTIDTNNDNIMQYVMLQGELSNIETIDRTKYSIITIKDAGIKVEELASEVCNWNEDMARDAIEALFLEYGDKIEVIISNNDAMAIGAIKALQKYGYNKGNSTKTIPVVGVDAIPEAQYFIKKGFMAGTIAQDANAMAEALYDVGMHLVNDKTYFDRRKYKFDDSGRIIQLPFHEYVD
ncbi:MAG TPA: galactose ABC transporter substrate-binding protein [Clostridium sp.]